MVTTTPASRNDVLWSEMTALGGGTPADLAIMVAGIVESTMRKALKPELHDEFLREVAKVAEAMRST
jgi:class 3 adenylate cyclase